MTISKILVIALLAGCAGNPATGVAANGDQLRVRYSTGTRTYVSNDVVGRDVHKDADGNEIGSTDHYEPVRHAFQWSEWKYFQGRDELDEQDFYRIAGDQQAADQVSSLRDSAAVKMKIGVPIMVLGLAASLVLSSMGQQNKDQNLMSISYAAGAVGTIGGLVWYWGRSNMATAHHLPASRADQSADVVEDCQEQSCTEQPGGRRPRR